MIIHIFLLLCMSVHFSFHLVTWFLMFFLWLFPSFFLFIRLSSYVWSSEDLRMEREKLLRSLLMTELWDNMQHNCWQTTKPTQTKQPLTQCTTFTVTQYMNLINPLSQGSSCSWRASVLQSLAPTCLNTPAWKFEVYVVRPWLAASGVFN